MNASTFACQTGILLYGAPGTGKTLLAKALANQSEANFISVKGPQLLSMWVGESERAVREVLSQSPARQPRVWCSSMNWTPSHRNVAAADQPARVTERVVSQMLTELDGIEELKGVVILAATNRFGPDRFRSVAPGPVRPVVRDARAR